MGIINLFFFFLIALFSWCWNIARTPCLFKCLEFPCCSPVLTNRNNTVLLWCNSFSLTPSEALRNVLARVGCSMETWHPVFILLWFPDENQSLCFTLCGIVFLFFCFANMLVLIPSVYHPLCAGSCQRAFETSCMLINQLIYLETFSNKSRNYIRTDFHCWNNAGYI